MMINIVRLVERFSCRRDSFITHRAFCDALAQESARHPTATSLTSPHPHHHHHHFPPSNINLLGLTGHLPAAAAAPRTLDHSQSSIDVLRLGSGSTVPADVSRSSDLQLPPPPPTMAASSGFFMQDHQNPNFHEPDHHGHQQGFLATNNNNNNKPLSFQHGLMNFPDGHNSPSVNLFNLSFLSTNTTTAPVSSGNLVISNPFGGGNAVAAAAGAGEGSTSNSFFPNNLMNSSDIRISSAVVPSLFSSSLQNSNSIPHMSATALLQKAAQMGSNSSNNNSNRNNSASNSILRSFGGGAYSENETNLHDLMNSFSAASSAAMDTPFGSYGINKGSTMDKQNMTRDFLGVGQMVRNMSGGGGGGYQQQQQQQHGRDHQRLGTSDSTDRNNVTGVPTSPPFEVRHASF